MLTQAKGIPGASTPAYAIAGDFCRIFAEDMSGLYLLSFLLTGDREKAEQCFVTGLSDCVEANRVFKEWARSWARRTIVRNAIRMVGPAPVFSGTLHTHSLVSRDMSEGQRTPIAAIIGLKPFERFVFVMSVLERYSDLDCRALLGCSRQDLANARARALEQVAAFAGENAGAPLGPEVIPAPENWLAKSA